MNKKYCILLFVFLLLFVLYEVFNLIDTDSGSGINIYIRNYTRKEYVLHLKFSNENGFLLNDLFIPIVIQRNPTSTYKATFDYSGRFNAKFKNFVLESELLSIPNGNIISRNIAFWPGEAGSSDGASSNRIAVEIGIVEKDGKPKIDLNGIL